MADLKISALTAATTPLAGTEVLPIVQSGVTVKVAVSNLTAGRDIAATSLTTAAIQAASSAGGTLKNNSGTAQMQWGSGGGSNLSLEVATNINPANAAVSISPTGTGTVAISPAGALTINPATASTINNASIGATTASTGRFTSVTATTGNVVIGTSGQGIDFSATPGTGTSELLDDYEEGNYTATMSPTSSGSITLAGTHNTLQYTIIGRQVTVIGMLMVNSVSSPSGAININLPLAAASGNSSNTAASLFVNGSNGPQSADFIGFVGAGTSTLQIYLGDGNFVQADSADAMQANTQMTISATYFV